MSLEKFTAGYFRAMTFAQDDDIPEDIILSDELKEKSNADCAKFYMDNIGLLPLFKTYDAGIDFYFTRNHEGTGFWAYPEVYSEETAELLTEKCKDYPPVELYAGDDGLLYAL